MTDFFMIGKIVGVHGLRGIVKVYSYAESPSVFEPGRALLLKFPGGEKVCVVKWAKPHARVILMSLEGTDDRNQAEELVGGEFFIERNCLPEPDEGAYYWEDLIGIAVFKTDGTFIGRIESIIPTGSNDVYVVADKGSETLIPALESVVVEVDPEAGVMRVDLPEGL
ncbi:ribosome maturation factor RimM [Desulfococcaceae bacterium HSG8]|nr:ribosome maturation factor RimM [Desulfococcaceae bacterium HSG8]